MVSVIKYCGQRRLLGALGYTCTLAEGHRSEFHMDVQAMATWSRAGDLVVHSDQRQAALRCATPASEHAMCAHEVNELRKQVTERGETIARLRNAIARTGPCCCADMGEGNLDLDDLCPKHGTVAELVRQLKWAHQFTATIEAACPPEITEPFSAVDVAKWVAEQLALVPALQGQLAAWKQRAELAERERDQALKWITDMGTKIANALNADTIAVGANTEILLDELIEEHRVRGARIEARGEIA